MAAEKKSVPKSMTEQRFLDHIYDGYHAGQRYCFVLGAGASKASGIRTGEEMMREWRNYLQDKGPDYIRDCAKELCLTEEDYAPLFQDDYTFSNDDYFSLFDLRFAGMPNVAYAYLEKEMEGKYPSYGYFPLAMLLTNTENRLVITTNFDTLLEDALYTYTFKHPLVVGHESLASYIGSDSRHPMIAKIHRDLLFRPFNRKQDMDKLKSEWEQPLRNALSRYTPIVIGYAGGDHTFMSLLEEIELNGIYWCYLGDAPSDKIQNIVTKHSGYLVKIFGFDEIMFRLGDRFAAEAKFGDPCEYIHLQAEERCALYRESLEKIKKECDVGKSDPEDLSAGGGGNSPKQPPSGDGGSDAVVDLIDAIERYDDRQSGSEADGGEILKLENEARKKLLLGEDEEALSLYTKLIGLNPQNAAYYERRSTALHGMKRYEEAVQDDDKAIGLEPDNPKYYHSRAVTLYAMGRYEQALVDRTKAIELDSGNAAYYYGRSITLYIMKQYEQALADATKAIELAPTNEDYCYHRAIMLFKAEKYEQALPDWEKAIELNPSNAVYYQQCAITLYAMKQYERALLNQAKAIELDPSNADYYFGNATILYEIGRYEEALVNYAKAIRLDPSNKEFYTGRAMTFRALGREEKAHRDEVKAKRLSNK